MPKYPRSGIICSQPVEYGHPLNRGRVAWWLTLPHLAGGPRWHDLMGLYPGTLTNMTTSASGWRGTTRPGGFGHLQFDGTNDHVTVSAASVAGLVYPFTFAAWVRDETTGSGGAHIFERTNGFLSNDIVIYTQNSARNPVIYVNGTSGSFLQSPGSISDGAWHHLAFTADGANFRAYLDGQATGFSPISGTLGTVAASGTSFIGSRAGTSFFWTGGLDDLAWWAGRVFSAAEVWSLYDESRSGHPNTLRRLSGRATVLMGGAAPVAAKVPWPLFSQRSA